MATAVFGLDLVLVIENLLGKPASFSIPSSCTWTAKAARREYAEIAGDASFPESLAQVSGVRIRFGRPEMNTQERFSHARACVVSGGFSKERIHLAAAASADRH
jgi:hypothetical protein